jgi:membrane-bound lytic murein transglycosylase B
MRRGGQAVLGAGQLGLVLLLAVSVMLLQPALSEPAKAQEALPTRFFDPDCDPGDARLLDPSRLEEPDGVCPPGALVPPAPKPVPQPESPKKKAPRAPGADDTPGQPGKGKGNSPRTKQRGKQQRPKAQKKSRSKKRKRHEPTGGTQVEPWAEATPEPPAKPRERDKPKPPGGDSGEPTAGNPPFGATLPGPAAPDIIERGSLVPPFLRPVYRAAGSRYGVRWEILAAINKIETNFGRNLNVSWAGATGWMQFMPATWRAYGTDGNRDGKEDPYNPTDAIFSAARYLKAAGYEHDARGALFAYNHADWYVEDVLKHARSIAADDLSPPAARRLNAEFASRLMRVADRAGVEWELMLAVLRARGRDGSIPASRAGLRALARRLVRFGARRKPRRAVRRLARQLPSPTKLGPRLLPREARFVERVVVLTHYNKAVGMGGLKRGLKKVKAQLARQVLHSPRLEIYPGGRADIQNGVTSVRVLALLAYLSSRYERVAVSSLTSGHSFLTASGNVSAHSYGRAVDIAALNGTPMLGHQKAGGLTERALWSILLLPDELEPSEVISLFKLGGPSFALADHADHIHVGF